MKERGWTSTTNPFTFLRVTIFNQENEKLGFRYLDWVLKWDIYEFINNPNKFGSFTMVWVKVSPPFSVFFFFILVMEDHGDRLKKDLALVVTSYWKFVKIVKNMAKRPNNTLRTWRAPKSRGETHLRVSLSQVAESWTW